jgi:hypothetical protein
VEAPIQIGMRTDSEIQVLSGIAVGDTIVTTGLLSIRKDSKLTLLKAAN